MIIETLTRPPDAVIEVPGSKSITNRALLVAGLATGTTVLSGALRADDTEAMIDAIEVLGAVVREVGGFIEVRGNAGELANDAAPIYARQAATVGRFLPAVAAAAPVERVVDGGGQLRRRPMAPLIGALRSAGAAVVELGEPDRLPITVAGPAIGGEIELAGDISSQFLSAMMLAGPLYERGLRVRLTSRLVSRPYVQMTTAVMKSFGVEARLTNNECSVSRGTYQTPGEYAIEPDASSASYVFAAAAMTGGRVRVNGLGRGSLQGDLQFVEVLAAMGATVEVTDDYVEVSGRATRGVEVDLADFSDTVPTLAVVAALAESPTTIRGIGFIRGKETDRIRAVAGELGRLGVEADELDDGLVVHPGRVKGGLVETYGDHRMAMAFALLGLVAPGIEISDPGCVAKTFPGYFTVLDKLRT